MEKFEEKELRLIADLERFGAKPQVIYEIRALNTLLFLFGLVIVATAQSAGAAVLGALVASARFRYRPRWDIKIENET